MPPASQQETTKVMCPAQAWHTGRAQCVAFDLMWHKKPEEGVAHAPWFLSLLEAVGAQLALGGYQQFSKKLTPQALSQWSRNSTGPLAGAHF